MKALTGRADRCRSCGGDLFRLERRGGVCVRCAPATIQYDEDDVDLPAGRGFAGWPVTKRRAVAGHGGRIAHQRKRAHEWTSAEAVAAGRKSGISRRHRAA